ncbi:MAG: acetyl/propionyl/methylcrotonyl-CoA carboxylase subunit alpha [Cyclobacteriaceae bacterium]
MRSTIKKILVANRGEIALRIMRTAREMGKEVVAVFSHSDRDAPHVLFADEAVCIGGPDVAESYLNIDRLIQACQQTQADAVHPGYGFLSENVPFAEALQKSNITYIGPSVESLFLMGSKISARNLAIKHGIPVVPGSKGEVKGIAEIKNIADSIGYPVLIKASAGGGGKGMRVIERAEDLASGIERAASEAKSSFGDAAVFVEKYIQSPRHIEVQIIADQEGTVVDLFERECSVQRRHQKVIEEAPSPKVDETLRKALADAAIKIAKACNYQSLGTVEFILDEKNNFYFLEMNTRIQVEHPVTECITGLDLVREQINISEGKPISFEKNNLRINGHAFELRIYAEDPNAGFLPDPGILTDYAIPAGHGVRVDDGYRVNMEVPVYYDPLIAKLIVHANTRTQAMAKMMRAISEFRISGPANTLELGSFVFQHPRFVDGTYDVNFLKDYWKPKKNQGAIQEEMEVAALVASDFYFENINGLLQKGHEDNGLGQISKWRNRLLKHKY